MQPHLRQRHPGPVAVAAALHGRQPRALDASRHPRPHPDGPPVRPARPAGRAHPHRAAGRRGLRGRPRPDRLAVRGHPRVRRGALVAGLPLPGPVRQRLVEPTRSPPRPGRPGARGSHLPALVPLAPHLERVRVPAARVPQARARRGDRPDRARQARLLVRAPSGGPAARRAHRGGTPHRHRRRRRPRGPLRPGDRGTRRARDPRPAAVRIARRGRGRGAVGGLPARAQRTPAGPGTGRHARARAAPGLDRPVRPDPAVRRMVTARLALDGAAAGRRDLRRPRPRPGVARHRARRGGPGSVPHQARSAHRPAWSGRTRRRDAGLRPGRRDVRRSRAARRRLAGRHARLAARPARPADLAGVRDPADTPRAPRPVRQAGPAHLAAPRPRDARGGTRLPGRGQGHHPYRPYREHTRDGRPHRPGAPHGRRDLVRDPAPRRRSTGGRPDHR